MITDGFTLPLPYMIRFFSWGLEGLVSRRPPCGYIVGGATGQAETIRDGPGPGRCRGYFINYLIRYHRVLGMLSELATEPIRTNCHVG